MVGVLSVRPGRQNTLPVPQTQRNAWPYALAGSSIMSEAKSYSPDVLEFFEKYSYESEASEHFAVMEVCVHSSTPACRSRGAAMKSPPIAHWFPHPPATRRCPNASFTHA